MSALTEFLSNLDSLSAAAFCEPDEYERLKKVQAAQEAACRFMIELNRGMDRFLEELFQEAEIGSVGEIKLRLKDAALTEPILEIFRSREDLHDFLDATKIVLELSQIDEEKIRSLSEAIQVNYEGVVEQSLDPEHLAAQFVRLRKYVCRGPEGGGGAAIKPKSPPGGKGGGANDREEKFLRRLEILILAATMMLAFPGKDSAPSPKPPVTPAPIVVPADSPANIHKLQLQLLGVLLLAVTVDQLSSEGEIPPSPPLEGSPAGNAVEKKGEARVLAHA